MAAGPPTRRREMAQRPKAAKSRPLQKSKRREHARRSKAMIPSGQATQVFPPAIVSSPKCWRDLPPERLTFIYALREEHSGTGAMRENPLMAAALPAVEKTMKKIFFGEPNFALCPPSIRRSVAGPNSKPGFAKLDTQRGSLIYVLTTSGNGSPFLPAWV